MDKRYTKPVPSAYCYTWGMQPTFKEHCESHPEHQTGMVTHEMIQARLREESDDLRADNERLREALKTIQAWDCLNPPRPDLLGDLPWLRRVVDAALAGAAP